MRSGRDTEPIYKPLLYQYNKMSYLFTSEAVSEGHPDKVADQISDAIVDEFLSRDPQARVAVETLVTTGQVIIAGEVKSDAYVDVEQVARQTIKNIGYNDPRLRFDGDSCGVLVALHEQSPDISRGVEKEKRYEQGAGDQGMMFGYACDETPQFMPLPIVLAHMLVKELAVIRREGKVMTYLRPDAKSQVTVEYDDQRNPVRVDTIVISTQHDEFVAAERDTTQSKADQLMGDQITEDVLTYVLPNVKAKLPRQIRALFDEALKLYVNPTGKFVLGDPAADTGLTGRKIIVDTYGGRGAHGGGAFSGKDSSKVDRSAAYAARHIAKNLVAAGIAHEALVQVAYAIGVAKPVSVNVNTYGTATVKASDGEIAKVVEALFDLRPAAIEERFDLRMPIYLPTAAYGHFGREPYGITRKVCDEGGLTYALSAQCFGWERLDRVNDLRAAFGLKP